MKRLRLVVSCEHASNAVPARYRPLFRGAREFLASHRGFDAGALEVARELARRFRAPLSLGRATRLLVDLNRSPRHRAVLSERTRALPPEVRRELLARWHAPYRAEVERAVARRLRAGTSVLHLSVHSFVQVLDGVRRDVDVGLLYDPARRAERELCARWREELRARLPGLRVRRNAPYRGTTDGLVTSFRRRFPPSYLGIELEVGQHLVRGPRARWLELRRAVGDSLAAVLPSLPLTRSPREGRASRRGPSP